MIRAELGVEVQRVERNREPIGDAAGVLGVGGGAAALLVIEPIDDGQRRRESTRLTVRRLAHATGEACPWRMKTPITSCPCSSSRWAATLESTPPDIARTTRAILQV